MALLDIIQASKRFGASPAVDRVSLSIERGEFFALLGPSGCGKTTLLRLIAGFETPDDGRIKIDGADMTAVPPYARPVNMMFQSYALFPHLDVAGNIAFGLRQAGTARRRRAGRPVVSGGRPRSGAGARPDLAQRADAPGQAGADRPAGGDLRAPRLASCRRFRRRGEPVRRYPRRQLQYASPCDPRRRGVGAVAA